MLAWKARHPRGILGAMSQENVEIVRQGYEGFAATGVINPDITASDFVWDMSNFHGWPEQQTYEGVAGAFAQVWTMRDGEQARVDTYSDRSEALGAAGLSE